MPQPEPGTPCERKPTGFNGLAANASPASLFRRNQRVVQRLCALVGLARAQAFGPGGECRALRERAEGKAEVHLAAEIHVRGAEARSDGRRVGKECVSTCRYRGARVPE